MRRHYLELINGENVFPPSPKLNEENRVYGVAGVWNLEFGAFRR